MKGTRELAREYGISKDTITKLKKTYTKEKDLIKEIEKLRDKKASVVNDVKKAKAIKVEMPRKFVGRTKEDLIEMLNSYSLEEQRNKKVEERVFATLEGECILVEFSNKTKATNPLVKDYQNILKTLTIIRKEIREVELALKQYENEESDVND